MDRNVAANIVISRIESGEALSEDELIAAGMCVKCAGFGFVDYEEDGFTEIPCDKCKDDK